jgi:Ca2+-binding EF-hand superfamily protein
MSNYIPDTQLSKYFITVLEGDLEIEKFRQQLASNKNFIPNLLFKSVDIDNKNFLSLNDFRTLLNDKSINFSDTHLRKFIHNYDRDRDFAINYHELLNIVLPRQNDDLRNAVLDREGQIKNYEENQPGMQNIHSEVEDAFVKILLKEMSLVENLAKIAEEMRNSKDFTSYEAFLAVDAKNQRYITESCIFNFLRKNGYNISEDEAKEILFKLDTDGDEKISYDEFQEIFFPIKLGSSNSSNINSTNKNNEEKDNKKIENVQDYRNKDRYMQHDRDYNTYKQYSSSNAKPSERETFTIQRDSSPRNITGDSLKYSSSNFNTAVGSTSIPRGNRYAPTFREEIYREENRNVSSGQELNSEGQENNLIQEKGENQNAQENQKEINQQNDRQNNAQDKSSENQPDQRDNRNINIEDNKSESRQNFYSRSPLRNEYLLRSIPREERDFQDFKDSKEKFFSTMSSFNRTMNQQPNPYLTSPNRLGYEELNLRATRNTYTSPLRRDREREVSFFSGNEGVSKYFSPERQEKERRLLSNTSNTISPRVNFLPYQIPPMREKSPLRRDLNSIISPNRYQARKSPVRSPLLERNLLSSTSSSAHPINSIRPFDKASTLANFFNDLIILDANCEVYRESLAMKTDANLKDLFALFDYSGRNSISLVDFKEVLKELDIYAGISELKLVFKRYDVNLDGSLE